MNGQIQGPTVIFHTIMQLIGQLETHAYHGQRRITPKFLFLSGRRLAFSKSIH
jgi:hypothetical protein